MRKWQWKNLAKQVIIKFKIQLKTYKCSECQKLKSGIIYKENNGLWKSSSEGILGKY